MLWWTILKTRSKNPVERVRGVQELMWIEGPRAADALVSTLQDENWDVRAAAIRALISRGDPRGQSYVTQLLSTRWNTKAADLLVTMGPQGVEALVAALAEPPRRSWPAVRVLQRLGWVPESEQHRAVFAVVEGKYSEAARCGSAAIEPLLAALKERHAAAEEIVTALGEINDQRSVPALIDLLASFGPERTAALEGLKNLCSVSSEPLLQALKHENARVREGAALALGELRDIRCLQPLLDAFPDEDHTVRAAVAFALGELKDTRVVTPLARALVGANEYLYQHILRALASTGDLLAVKALATALQDKSVPARMRDRTAEIMKEIACGGPLAEALLSENEEQRQWGASTANQLQTPERIAWLAKSLHHQDAAVREKAARITGELRDEGGVEVLLEAINDAQESVARAAAEALAKIGAPSAVEPLIQILQDREKTGRAWAATALGDLRDERAAAPLLAALRDTEARVRAHAARALSGGKNIGALEPLAALIDDTDAGVREAAIYALATMDQTRATEVVRSALSHDDLSTRKAATRAWQRKAGADGIAALVPNLTNGDDELAYAASDALETVLKRSAAAASVQDLRAVDRLEDMVLVESRATAESAGPVEIQCRHLRQLARTELIRRGAATGLTGEQSSRSYRQTKSGA